jgi:hypothetical protein
MKCGYDVCIKSLYHLDDELITCLVILYITPWLYIIFGMYFYEVIPQQFGVRKSPFFFLSGFLNFKKKKAFTKNDIEYVPALNGYSNDDNELAQEIKKVQQVSNQREKFPLIAENLTKIYKGSGARKSKKALSELNLVLNNNEIFGLLG